MRLFGGNRAEARVFNCLICGYACLLRSSSACVTETGGLRGDTLCSRVRLLLPYKHIGTQPICRP